VETADRFNQLADGLGQYTETSGKSIRLRTLNVAVLNDGES
jgi:hypothetical protein